MANKLVKNRLVTLIIPRLYQEVRSTINKFVLISICLLFSCVSPNKDKANVDSSWEQNVRLKMLDDFSKAINEGDCEAYKHCSAYYYAEANWDEFFYYAYFMARKYNCAYAHFDIYYFMNEELTINHARLNLDDGLKKDAIYHLLQAYYLNKELAKDEIHRIFKDKKIPTLKKYREIIDSTKD